MTDFTGNNTNCTNTTKAYLETGNSSGYFKMYNSFLSDFDECSIQPCHPNATCVDLHGSYNCICNPGFSGDMACCESKMLAISLSRTQILYEKASGSVKFVVQLHVININNPLYVVF